MLRDCLRKFGDKAPNDESFCVIIQRRVRVDLSCSTLLAFLSFINGVSDPYLPSRRTQLHNARYCVFRENIKKFI